MIVSVSRRTDIPSFYGPWFARRIREGFADVRNPFNPKQVYRVPLNPDIVDCFVFWTRNPAPFLPLLDKLDREGYRYYFQVTVTPYEADLEPGGPSIEQSVEGFKRLSEIIGSKRIIWRYDPVLLSEKYNKSFHVEAFRYLLQQLGLLTEKVTISYLDPYRKISRNMKKYGFWRPQGQEEAELAGEFASAAADSGLKIETCAENLDLQRQDIKKGACIAPQLIEDLSGRKLVLPGIAGPTRQNCGCIYSVDIGAYNSCPRQCLYCYADSGGRKNSRMTQEHDPCSSFLTGRNEEKVPYKKGMKSYLARNQGEKR